MSVKHSIRNYVSEILVEYGRIIDMDGRTWSF